MEKIIGDWSTSVSLSNDESKEICRMGQGSECCAFLTVGSNGFECIRMAFPTNNIIFKRLEDGTMNAKGHGGWKGCAWEGEI